MNIKPLTLPFPDWPQSDQEAWEQARAEAGYFDQSGRASHWTEKTARQVLKDWGLYLGYIDQADNLGLVAGIGSRITKKLLYGYVEHLQSRSLAVCSQARAIRNVREFVRVTDPAASIELLSRLLARFRAIEAPSQNKSERIIPTYELVTGALGYIDEALTRCAPSEHIRASWIRDGLMLAFLALHPIRLANLTNLKLKDTFFVLEHGYECRLKPDETKTSTPYEFELSPELTPYMDVYVGLCRNTLLGNSKTNQLWVSTRRGSMAEHAVYMRIVETSTRIFGKPLNPHLLRDCYMTTIAELAPEMVGAASRVLGHSSLNMSTKHYNQAKAKTAQEDHNKLIAELRETVPEQEDV